MCDNVWIIGYPEAIQERRIWETDQPRGEIGSILEVSPTADGHGENVVQT
jgi:hypothetical protein